MPVRHRSPGEPPVSRRTRFIGTAALLLLLAGAGTYAWQQRSAAAVPTLITAPVTRGDIEETVLATGTLKPVKLVAVGAQASGRITTVKVKLGDVVRAGDLLAEIDSVTQQNDLRTAEAALANVTAQRAEKQATLRLNETTLARQKRMVDQNAVSRADFDTAEADVDITRAQIDALSAQIVEAQVAVDTARANLGYTRITAPTDGTVLSIVSQQGQTVNAVQSAPTIVILGNLDTMTVRTEISEADIVRVKQGQPLYFTVLGEPERRYDAMLGFIEPAPESIRSDSSFSSSSSTTSSSSSSSSSSEAIYYNGVFDVPNPDGRLRTYMTAEVHIVLGSAKGVLTIPASALGERDGEGRYQVRIAGPNDSVSTRTVEIGLNNKITAQVLSGLEEGERVVIDQANGQTAASSSRRPGPPMGL
ncbi:efflux RND transporter periplasmic adaptor subunit [Ancylobacter oerskovii]|uniref:Efflux RND transporter periplasmic adaptor subunit n=1 Tax=Ancylobacter oerskovii TaxID=459519 RepID=A0ABW4YUQ8_9HYPH|nr:efflux RND transporter periplasmic adaptor subunit [Ancylobacter oerskovii]